MGDLTLELGKESIYVSLETMQAEGELL